MKSHKKMRCCEWELLEILDKCVHCGSCLNGIGLHISLSLYNSYCRNLLWFFYYQVFCSLSGFIYRNSGDTIQQPCMVCEKMFNSSSHAVLLNCDYFSCHLWLWFCFHLPSKPDFLAFIWSKLLFLKCILLHFFFLNLELRVFVIFCLFVYLFARSYSHWYTPPPSHWKNPEHCFNCSCLVNTHQKNLPFLICEP